MENQMTDQAGSGRTKTKSLRSKRAYILGLVIIVPLFIAGWFMISDVVSPGTPSSESQIKAQLEHAAKLQASQAEFEQKLNAVIREAEEGSENPAKETK